MRLVSGESFTPTGKTREMIEPMEAGKCGFASRFRDDRRQRWFTEPA
jgi:hypothetical protein